MRLQAKDINRIKSLLAHAKETPVNNLIYRENSAPGTVHSEKVGKIKRPLHHYETTNVELVEILSTLANQKPQHLVSLHRIYYTAGDKALPHYDPSTCTLVILLEADFKEGGDLILGGTYIRNFNREGEYVIYNGGKVLHEVKELKDGYREVLVAFWKDPSPMKSVI